MDQPPEATYRRVTNPERYAVVRDETAALIDELRAEFDVEIIEDVDDGDFTRGRHCDAVVRLVPAGAGAPVTVACTRFPGIYVRFGNWTIYALPHCGCDACAEDPSTLVDDLRRDIREVADGLFQEEFTRSRELRRTFGSSSGSTWLDRGMVPAGLRPHRSQWGPWRRRSQVDGTSTPGA
ncbi:MAG: DUF6226 family protein [Acidimicrobiales bacterium]